MFLFFVLTKIYFIKGTARGNCMGPRFFQDEYFNEVGPSRCSEDCQCDGNRKCLNNHCVGTARDTPLIECNSPFIFVDESQNNVAPGACLTDCNCDGNRRCQNGFCAGKFIYFLPFNLLNFFYP